MSMTEKEEASAIEYGAKLALEAIINDMGKNCAAQCKSPLLLAGRFRRVVADVIASNDVGAQAVNGM